MALQTREASSPLMIGTGRRGSKFLSLGRADQVDHHGCLQLRIDEMPLVEPQIPRPTETLIGNMAPGVPPLAPAVVKAIASTAGRRPYRLPLPTSELTA